MKIIFDGIQLEIWQIVGLVAGALLIILFITWLITNVVDITLLKRKNKILHAERNKQIAFENEIHQFITTEIKKQLEHHGLIKQYYTPDIDTMKR